MPSLLDPASTWDVRHLRALIGEPEGIRLDFKLTLDDGRKKRLEIAKDVSGFANADGGRIVLGMAEETSTVGSVASEIVPLTDEGIPDRIRDTVASVCVPRPAFALYQIPYEGGYCLVVDVPMSVAPIMVVASDENRYYRRHLDHTVKMGEREVREAYARVLEARVGVDQRIADAGVAQDMGTLVRSHFEAMRWEAPPAWYQLLVVPTLAGPELFDPARLELDPDLVAPLLGELPLVPSARGLEGSHEMLTRPESRLITDTILVSHTGVIEITRLQATQRDRLSLARGRTEMFGLRHEVPAVREALTVAAGICEAAGYWGPVALRSRYRHLRGLFLNGTAPNLQRVKADEASFFSETDTAGLRSGAADAHVGALFDRVAQCAGLTSIPREALLA